MSTANQHDWQLWLRIRRTIDDLFGEKAKTSPECSEADIRTGLTITQQVYVGMRSDGVGHGYFYQQPRANGDPLDHLLLTAGKDANSRVDESSED